MTRRRANGGKRTSVARPVPARARATDDSPDFSPNGSYRWQFTYKGALVDLLGNDQDFVFNEPGVYYVHLFVRDGIGNIAAPVIFRMTVLPAPDRTKPFVTVGEDITLAVGSNIVFNGSATDDGLDMTNPAAFTWSFTYNGTLVVLTGPNPAFVFVTPGIYVVTLTVRDAAGNEGSGVLFVKVEPVRSSQPLGPGVALVLILMIALAAAAAAGVLYFLRLRPRGG